MSLSFIFPKREYSDGPKKMVSIRLPVKLMKELERIAESNGSTVTDVATTVLDQFIQWSKDGDALLSRSTKTKKRS